MYNCRFCEPQGMNTNSWIAIYHHCSCIGIICMKYVVCAYSTDIVHSHHRYSQQFTECNNARVFNHYDCVHIIYHFIFIYLLLGLHLYIFQI